VRCDLERERKERSVDDRYTLHGGVVKWGEWGKGFVINLDPVRIVVGSK
jgi:hypothetical protein